MLDEDKQATRKEKKPGRIEIRVLPDFFYLTLCGLLKASQNLRYHICNRQFFLVYNDYLA